MSDLKLKIIRPQVKLKFPTSLPGPPGPQGPAGGSVVTVQAGENLNAGRVVVVIDGEAFHFQPADDHHQGGAFGITTSSALSGADVTVQRFGEVTDSAYSGLLDGVCWVTTNGQITSTFPASGNRQKAGFKTNTNTVSIDFSIHYTSE